MTRTIQIGPNRRLTIEELVELCYDPSNTTLELVCDGSVGDGKDAESEPLSFTPSEDGDNLSEAQSIAVVTLLAQSISQGRLFPKSGNLLGSRLVSSLSGSSPVLLPKSPSLLPSELTSFLPAHILRRTYYLAIGALSSGYGRALAKCCDGLSSLSASKYSVDPFDLYSEVKFDTCRPHSCLISSAANLRAMLENSNKNASSNSEKEAAPECIRTIPNYHGPALDAIKNSCKVLELELNCFELVVEDELEMTLVSLALKECHTGVKTLLEASQARIGAHKTDQDTDKDCQGDWTDTTIRLADSLFQLRSSLEDEASISLQDIQSQILKQKESLEKKEATKAARAAASATQTIKAPSNGDEFAGMTDAQIQKIQKKRAEKEAKKRAKESKKQTADPASSLFGRGVLPLMRLLETPSLTLPTLYRIHTLQAELLSGGIQRKPKLPKGTRDYLPEQMTIRQEAFRIIRRVFNKHGAVEIDTPVFERSDTLTGKYGEEGGKLIYDLADQGGELLSLRYDLTVPFARFLALNNLQKIKRFHIGKVYRRDQPQLSKGRYREFYQCDFDIAGVFGRMVPDSECLCVAAEILSELDIGKFCIKLNHRKLLDAILDLCGVPADKFRTICSAIDKLDKEPWEEVKREMVEEKGLTNESADKIGTFVLKAGKPWELYNLLMEENKFDTHQGAMTALEDLKILFGYLDAMGVIDLISFDLSLARGLDYYTGVIYEAVCMEGNVSVGSIGGGGRYDNLVSMFMDKGKIVPCVGVSVGVERVFTLIEARLREKQGGSIQTPNVSVLIASTGPNMLPDKMKIAKLLWDANISAEFNHNLNAKLKYEIQDALSRALPYLVIVGEEELKEGKCKVKCLEERLEETVEIEGLVAYLREKGLVPVGCEFAAEMGVKF